jgi:hypothetical protein
MKIKFENKRIRAEVIAKYIKNAGYDGVVCFSCGNASAELKKCNINVIDISPNGGLIANKWWRAWEIKKAFPLFFNATSGYLNLELMYEIGIAFKKEIGNLPTNVEVDSGSGETAICLALVYPNVKFTAIYNNNNLATTFNAESPLNVLVKKLCNVEHINQND